MNYNQYLKAVKLVSTIVEQIKTSDKHIFTYRTVCDFVVNYYITSNNGNTLSAKDWIINLLYYRIEDGGSYLSLDKKEFNEFKDNKRLQIVNVLYDFILKYGTLLERRNEECVHSFKEVVDMCEKYKEVDMNTVFDKWYNVNYGRTNKLLKLLK